MKLVNDWRRTWRWHSVWLAAALAAMPAAWDAMPPDIKAYVPEAWLPYIAGLMFIAFLIGRLRDQSK